MDIRSFLIKKKSYEDNASAVLECATHNEKKCYRSIKYCSTHSQIEQNRKKLVPILSSIIFCVTRDLAIRGQLSCSKNVHDHLKFHV